jgi:hypothetical protein
MRKVKMTREFWMPKMLPFLIPIEALKELREDAYEVKGKLKMVFLFDGGFNVTGEKDNVSINFNDPDLLILMTGPNPVHIYRIPYHRLVGFDLIISSKKSGKMSDDTIKFFRN